MKKKAIPCHKAGRITSFFLLISIFLLIPSITTPVFVFKRSFTCTAEESVCFDR